MNRLIVWILLLSLSVSLIGCGNKKTNDNALTISAATNLKGPLEKIKQSYEENVGETEIVIKYGGSGNLRQEIQNGANVDIFVSANNMEMDKLSKNILIDESSRKNLLKNKLVLITNKDRDINSVYELRDQSIGAIATTEQGTAAIGTYTNNALNYYGLLDSVISKFVFAKDLSIVIDWVASKQVDCGFTYYTDAINNSDVYIVEEFPEEATGEVTHPIAIIKSSNKKEDAVNFIEYLDSEESQQIFKDFGFTMY